MEEITFLERRRSFIEMYLADKKAKEEVKNGKSKR